MKLQVGVVPGRVGRDDVGDTDAAGDGLVRVGEHATRHAAEQVVGETGVDMAMFGTMRFWNDVVGQFEASFLAPQRQQLEVVGEDGLLRALAPWRVDWGGALLLEVDGAVEEVPVEEASSYRLELENLADAIAGDAPALLGRDDAVAQARAIDALYRSASEGAAVAV